MKSAAMGAPAMAVSHDGLEAIEQHRAGGDLDLWVELHAVLFGAGVEVLDHPAGTGQACLVVPAVEWARQLERVEAAASVHVLVHQPLLGGRRADAVGYVRRAQRLIVDGHYDLAVVQGRRALDVLNEIDPVPADAPTAKQRNTEQRRAGLRWAELRRGLTVVANAAPHEDVAAAAVPWSRQDAIAVVATIAGLLQRVEGDTDERMQGAN